jgi:RNA polymerase sigma-70 factor (ECF subfamily)
MDEISLLRRSRNDIPERDAEDIARGRAALFAAIDSNMPYAAEQPPRRRRAATWAGVSMLGAGALALTLVAANLAGIPGTGGADAAAAAVLESAAAATVEGSDPIVGPGQFMLVQTDHVSIGSGNLDSSAETVSFIGSTRGELYVPSDRSDNWVWVRCGIVPVQTFGPRSEELAAIFVRDDVDTFRVAPGGVLYEDATIMGVPNYDSYPRDPEQLLEEIYRSTLIPGAARDVVTGEARDGQMGPSRDGAAFVRIADLLRVGTVPADLRAALYKTAALIPGVSVTEQQATLNGATGTAIGRVETTSNIRQDLIIDPVTGQFIGERQVLLGETAGMPAGTEFSSASVTTTVVDTAPTDASGCSRP